MPKLDSYMSLIYAYDYNQAFIENFNQANSLRFGGVWNKPLIGSSGPPPPRPPGPGPPPPPRPPVPGPPSHHYPHHYPENNYHIPPSYYMYDRPYRYYSNNYPYFNNFSDYLPLFYNMYAYSPSPYNTSYNQYVPRMNTFWENVISSIRNYPDYPTKTDIDRMKDFIINLPIFVPCNDSCKSFMKVYLQEQYGNLDSICQNKKFLVKFFDDLRHQFFLKFENDSLYI